LSDFQEELRNDDGYEEIVIIAVGQSNIDAFNENFCSNSDLPLVSDQYPDLPIRAQFNGQHKEVVILDRAGEIVGRRSLTSGLNTSAKDYIREVIAEHYEQEDDSVEGDLNGDDIVNIQDIVLIINVIINGAEIDNADINDDGIINILDVVQIINIIIG